MKKIWLEGMMGLVIGDALGLPVQFIQRNELKKNPSVVYVYQGIDVGAKMEEKASFSQIFCRILISTTSIDELNRVINLI